MTGQGQRRWPVVVRAWFCRFPIGRCGGLLELVVLRFRSEREKEIEILLLRHQLRVLERQLARPQLTQADRALLAGFSRVSESAGVAEISLCDVGDAVAAGTVSLSPAAGRTRIGVLVALRRPRSCASCSPA
jgi:hypothetical protein